MPSSSTYGRAKALLASEAPPVAPIRPVPDEQQRKQAEKSAESIAAAAGDDAGAVGGGRRRAAGYDKNNDAQSGGGQSSARPNVDLRTLDSGPTATFVAQSLYQESMGTGLHIEPWSQALGAYRRADSTAGQAGGAVAITI